MHLDPPERIHFVTGRLAEHALREVLKELAPRVGFRYTLDVLPITVAALMTPEWIARRIHVPPDTDRVLLPGYCEGDLRPVEAGGRGAGRAWAARFAAAGRILRPRPPPADYGAHDIQIVAEINHCPRLPLAEILAAGRAIGGRRGRSDRRRLRSGRAVERRRRNGPSAARRRPSRFDR